MSELIAPAGAVEPAQGRGEQAVNNRAKGYATILAALALGWSVFTWAKGAEDDAASARALTIERAASITRRVDDVELRQRADHDVLIQVRTEVERLGDGVGVNVRRR